MATAPYHTLNKLFQLAPLEVISRKGSLLRKVTTVNVVNWKQLNTFLRDCALHLIERKCLEKVSPGSLVSKVLFNTKKGFNAVVKFLRLTASSFLTVCLIIAACFAERALGGKKTCLYLEVKK
jgi:hypothetical protein